MNRDNETEDRVVLPLVYHPRLGPVSSRVRDLWLELVDRNPDMKKVMPQPPMIGFQRPKNMRDTLIRAQLPKPSANRQRRDNYGFCKCDTGNCLTCIYSDPAQNHKSSVSGETWPIMSKINCKTKRVIYSCTCDLGNRTCPDHPQYVGKTKRPAHVRFTEHRNSVKPDATTTVGQHYNQPGHGIHDMVFLPFERVASTDPFVLEDR